MNQYIVNFLEIFVDFNYNHNLIITSKKTLFPYKINDKSPKNYIYLYLLIKPIKTILIIGFLTFALLYREGKKIKIEIKTTSNANFSNSRVIY